jgi:hypothetical protein
MARKLYRVLWSFEESEKKSFAGFLREDDRPAGKRLQKFNADLWRYVMHLSDEEEIRAAENKVASRLEEKNLDLDRAYRKWCAKLMRKVRQFLVQEEIDRMPEEFEDLLLLRAYARRELNSMFSLRYGDLKKKLEKRPPGDWVYLAQFIAYTFYRDTHTDSIRGKKRFLEFQQQMEPLIHYFLHHITVANTCICNRKNLQKITIEPIFPDLVQDLAGKMDLSGHPGIFLNLQYVEQFSKQASDGEKFAFADRVLEHFDSLNKENKLILLGFAYNLILPLHLQGDMRATIRVIELTVFGLKERVWEVNGKLPLGYFKNALYLTIQFRREDVREWLLENYPLDRIIYLNGEQAAAFKPFLAAHLAFEAGDYSTAMKHADEIASRHHLHDVQLEIAARTLRAQLQYLNGRYQECLTTTDNLRMFVAKNDYVLRSSSKFIRYPLRWLRKLGGAVDKDRGRIEKLLQELEAEAKFRLKPFIRTELQKLLDAKT